jgi:hypothetical protein
MLLSEVVMYEMLTSAAQAFVAWNNVEEGGRW